MHYPTDGRAHTTSFVTPVVEHWLEREIVGAVDDFVQEGIVLFCCHVTYLSFVGVNYFEMCNVTRLFK